MPPTEPHLRLRPRLLPARPRLLHFRPRNPLPRRPPRPRLSPCPQASRRLLLPADNRRLPVMARLPRATTRLQAKLHRAIIPHLDSPDILPKVITNTILRLRRLRRAR